MVQGGAVAPDLTGRSNEVTLDWAYGSEGKEEGRGKSKGGIMILNT